MRALVALLPLIAACSGSLERSSAPHARPLVSTRTAHVPPPSPPRAWLARLDRRCRLERIEAGSGAPPEDVGLLPGPCPRELALTWTDRRLVAIAPSGVVSELGVGPIAGPPLRVEQAAFDDAGALHACGTAQGIPVTFGGIDANADYRGRRLLGHRPRHSTRGGVSVPFTLGPSGWVEGLAELQYAAPTDSPGFAPCGRVDEFPQSRYATSDGPAPVRWALASTEDQSALSSVAPGDWRVDPTGTIATRGPRGPHATKYGGGWHRAGPPVAAGPWVVGDWVGVRGADGFQLVSRRDGQIAFTQEPGTVVFPWPEGAPVPGT